MAGSSSPTLAVVGASGFQGGSVVDALLTQGTYSVRGITRNLSSESVRKLVARGVDVRQADLGDVSSLAKVELPALKLTTLQQQYVLECLRCQVLSAVEARTDFQWGNSVLPYAGVCGMPRRLCGDGHSCLSRRPSSGASTGQKCL